MIKCLKRRKQVYVKEVSKYVTRIFDRNAMVTFKRFLNMVLQSHTIYNVKTWKEFALEFFSFDLLSALFKSSCRPRFPQL